jgi:hypothetical protein
VNYDEKTPATSGKNSQDPDSLPAVLSGRTNRAGKKESQTFVKIFSGADIKTLSDGGQSSVSQR